MNAGIPDIAEPTLPKVTWSEPDAGVVHFDTCCVRTLEV